MPRCHTFEGLLPETNRHPLLVVCEGNSEKRRGTVRNEPASGSEEPAQPRAWEAHRRIHQATFLKVPLHLEYLCIENGSASRSPDGIMAQNTEFVV